MHVTKLEHIITYSHPVKKLGLSQEMNEPPPVAPPVV